MPLTEDSPQLDAFANNDTGSWDARDEAEIMRDSQVAVQGGHDIIREGQRCGGLPINGWGEIMGRVVGCEVHGWQMVARTGWPNCCWGVIGIDV